MNLRQIRNSMNRITLLALALLNLVPAFAAEQTLTFPKAAPAFSIGFAETWRFIPDGDDTLSAQSIAPQDEAVTVELRALDAEQADKALAEAGKLLGGEYGRLQADPMRKDTINTLKVMIFKAAGENSDGGRMIIRCALFQPSGSGKYYMLTFSCTPGEESRHLGDLGTILSSVKLVHPVNKRYVTPLFSRSPNRSFALLGGRSPSKALGRA
jgi:hypothetical protein